MQEQQMRLRHGTGEQMRLIDAEEPTLQWQLKFIMEVERQIYGAESWCFAGKCRHAIEDAPTIEERKRGKWIQDNIASNIFKCSECGCDAPVDPTAGCEIKSNFCYCCGAEMSNSEGRKKINL